MTEKTLFTLVSTAMTDVLTKVGLVGKAYWEPAAKALKQRIREAPRERLSARLAVLVAIKQWEVLWMKEILADTEAIQDARAHRMSTELRVLEEMSRERGEGDPP